MYIETTTKTELKDILVHNILKYNNCIIELVQGSNPPLYVIVNKISNDTISIAIGTRDKIVGDIVKYDKDEIENVLEYFILDRISYKFYAKVKVTPTSESNHNEINNSHSAVREEYIENQYNILNSKPITLEGEYDIKKFLKIFLHTDDCNKLIITFSVSVPDLEKDFCMSITCDKVYICNRDIVVITLIREDVKNCDDSYLKLQKDKLVQFEDHDSNKIVIDEFMEYFNFSMQMCKYVSDNEIKINAYSNVKLN